MKKFALIGAAGFVAPRHMQAIKETGNALVAAMDKNDSVGIIDNYFPKADFFTEFERFDRHLDKLKRAGDQIDYLSICTPNYLHDAHIRFGLRAGAEVICEKPLVLNPWNVEALKEIETETGKKINTILQLRHHPNILALKETVSSSIKRHQVDLTYITSRGNWYQYSWKGDILKSGGIASNIGVHFFDMLLWIFGELKEVKISKSNAKTLQGTLVLEKADVSWLLSIDEEELPTGVSQKTYRILSIDGKEVSFSNGFTDLHTLSYQEILKGNGWSIEDALPSIELTYKIRQQLNG